MGRHAIHVVLVQKASNQGEEDDTTIKKIIQILMRIKAAGGFGKWIILHAARCSWSSAGCIQHVAR